MYHPFYPETKGKAMKSHTQPSSSNIKGWHIMLLIIGLILVLKPWNLDAEDWQSLADAIQRMG